MTNYMTQDLYFVTIYYESVDGYGEKDEDNKEYRIACYLPTQAITFAMEIFYREFLKNTETIKRIEISMENIVFIPETSNAS